MKNNTKLPRELKNTKKFEKQSNKQPNNLNKIEIINKTKTNKNNRITKNKGKQKNKSRGKD